MQIIKQVTNSQNMNNQESLSHKCVVVRRIHRLLKYAGFNAIELSLVLGVIAIAIVGVIRIMAGNTDKQNSSQMVNDVSTLVANIKNAYSSSREGYTSLNTETAIRGKMVPPDLKIGAGNTSLQNQFQGGTVTIDADSSGENFTVTYTNVPTSICNTVINTLGGVSFLSIKVNTELVYDINAEKLLDATDVSKACDAGREKSTIVFTAS